MHHLDTPLELKFLAEAGTFEGYASVFGVTDKVGDRIAPGAFRKTLDAWAGKKRLPPMLWQHESRQPIGVWEKMHEDSHGLYVEGRLFIADIPQAAEAYKLLRENVVTGLSIGYRTKESHVDHGFGARVLTEVDLLEVSMVTFPANDMARVSLVKSLDAGRVPSPREFEAFLREAGFSRKQARGVIAQGYKSLPVLPCDADGADMQELMDMRHLTQTILRLSS